MVTIPVIDDVPFTANQRLACSLRVWAGVPLTFGPRPLGALRWSWCVTGGRVRVPQTLLGCLLMQYHLQLTTLHDILAAIR